MKKRNKRKMKKVTKCPRWLLKMQGKRDARKGGKQTVDMKINEWVQNLGTFENDVYTEEEKKLLPLRKNAAQAIHTLNNLPKNTSPSADSNSRAVDMNNPKAIRAARRASADAANLRNSITGSVNNCKKDILQYNETLISSDVDTSEHIDRLRNHCKMCISRYLSGVLKILPDYTFDNSLITSNAKNISVSQHHQLDSEIRRIAYNMVTTE